MTEVFFPLGGGYSAYIGSGAISLLQREAEAAFPAGRRVLIADANIPAPAVGNMLSMLGEGTELLNLRISEAEKTLKTVEGIYSFLYGAGVTRRDGVVAAGGGVLLDTAGFAAATYLRGVGCILAPTTVIAQTDSAYGGKTGVDFMAGKNHVGAFAHPRSVVCDTQLLLSLPERERACGMGEVIKYGVIAEPEILDEVSREFPGEELVARCVRIKREYVSVDEFDTGVRRTLNFGHTAGHAFEAASGFTLSHGQAVAYGMLAEAKLGEALGVTKPEVFPAIETACKKAGLDTEFAPRIEAALPYLSRDKKNDGNAIELVLPTRLGSTATLRVTAEELKRCLIGAAKGAFSCQ